MMNSERAERKQAFLMKLAKILFEPEITFEDEAIQGNTLNEPYVIISNHSRRTGLNRLVGADGPMLRYVFNNKNICSLMAADLMEKPIFKFIVDDCDCIPVCRNAASTEWLRKCKEKLDEGISVVIFPEGTTLKEKDIEEFKAGFALLARMADVKVLPMAIGGVYRPFAKGKLKIRVGVPTKLQIQKGTSSELKKEAKRFQHIIEDMFLSLKTENTNNKNSLDADREEAIV